MKNFNKKIALIAALACAGTMLAGCNSNTTDGGNAGGGSVEVEVGGGNAGGGDAGSADGGDAGSAPAAAVDLPDDGDKLTILCWTGDDINPMIDYFVANTDYTIDQVVFQRVGESGGEAREQYQQYLSGDGDADLLVLEADWILQYLNDGYTVPLSSLGIDKGDYSNAYSYTTAIGTDESGTLRAATWQCAPGGYVYRTDLAEQYLGVTSPEEMQAKVGDWSKFEEAAKTVSEASGGKTAMAATLGGMWQVYQYNRTQPWVVNNKVVLDNAENFLDIAKTYRENNWVTDVGQWSDAWYAIGQDDSTMGYFFSTWCLGTGAMLSNAEGGEGGATYGKYNICPGPSGYAWGGSWLAASTKCNNKTMASEFVKMFTVDTDNMKGYALSKGEFVNNKAAMQAIVDEGSNSNPLLGGQDQFAVLMDSANAIKMDGLITKYDSAIKEQFNNAVTDYVDGKYATKDDALNGFQDAVAAIYPDFDWD